ncbi:MAG: NUDIX hydrolase [Clostridia bacterium]|jgi:ADP-ribose pyrophosphatase YjhB (NUDIX family)|nr:NUDIX hydrolase [Clostridia bacterium]
MSLTDRNGQTEEEFLRGYDRTAWDRPSLTADVVVFSVDDNRPVVLLVKRGGHPYLGCWAFPGGFVHDGETTEQAAGRELKEETGLEGLYLDQMYLVSTPNRDPRGWTVTACYMAVMDRGTVQPVGGDDADEAAWFNIDYVRNGSDYVVKLTCGDNVLTARLNVKRDKMGNIDVNETEIVESEGLAFDHVKLLLYAIERL